MTRSTLLTFSIFICCFTAVLSIRELMPDAEYLKKSSKCPSDPPIVSDSYVLPFETSFRLDCGGICTKYEDSVALKHLWLFQPSDELKVYYLPGNQTTNYAVTENGTLEIGQITRNGVFYCQYSGKIYAMYSISTMNAKFLEPVLETPNLLNEEVTFLYTLHLTGRLSTVKKFQTNCSTLGQIGIKRSVYQHEVSLHPTVVEMPDSAVLKIQRFNSISMFDFGVADSKLITSLSGTNLPIEAAVYQFTFCKENPPKDHKNNAEKFTYQQILARNQIFKTKFKNLGESALLSCAFKGVKEYRWKKVSLSNGNRSQWLSALYLHVNTVGRMRIDFLSNLYFESLQREDYEYRYVCYDGDQPVVSFAFKLDVSFSSLLELLPQPDVMTIICVALSTVIIFWTILSSPDISSKL